MPLSRYPRIRNEYTLSDPQLYKLPDKNDPEALLEGVSMAGLIGLLRQLGDLAQFAGEVFHDLHEEVMATASRGHTLIIRVQQLEDDCPLVERMLLTQTSHTSFLYNSGVECHPNIRMDENLVTRGDLPRVVTDSYEECRGPPRLFLLDKFDLPGAGAGTCLKRYTDPSFFKRESISSGRNSEGQREKKSQRLENRVPPWRNCDTLKSFPSSHAKLHQLFLEESLENDGTDTEHRVKLKRRQFTGSFLDHDKKRSYMEKFVYITPPELKFSISSARDLGPEIVDTTEVKMKPSLDNFGEKKSIEITDSGAKEVSGLNYGNETCKIVKLVNDEECADIECNSEVSVVDCFVSEIVNYTDAKAIVADFYEREGHREPQSLSSESQSTGNSTTSEDGSNFFEGRENSSSSISANSSLAESNMAVEADDFPGSIPAIEETANVSCHTDLKIIHRPTDMEASLCKNSLPKHEVDEENSNFANLEVVDSPIAPQRADTGHWLSVKHPLHDEAGQNSVVCLENLDNLSSTSDDSVYFPLIEPREADIGPPSVDKHLETNNTIDTGPVNRHSGPEFTQSLNIQEQFCEAATPDQAPLLGYVEHDKSGAVFFGNEPNSNVISGSLVGNATYLDDYGTQTIQIKSDAMIDHECSDKHQCQSKDLCHDAFQSEMSSELVITYNFVTATESESNSSLDHNVDDDHTKTVYNCCQQTDVDNDLQENVMPVVSSENLNAEKLQGQAVSLTEDCHHDEEELVCGQNSDLAMQKDEDASQFAALNTEGNMTCISYDNPEPSSGLQDDDSKVNILQSIEVYSQSTNCPQPSGPKPPLKSSDCTLESSRQQVVYSTNGLSGTSQAIHEVMNHRHLGGPSFPVLDMLQDEPPLSLEPPPLPPLPPMQWRLGRSQNSLNKTEIVPRLPRTQEHQEYSNDNASESPAVSDVSSQDNKIGIRREYDISSFVSAQASMGYQNGNQTSKDACQPSKHPPDSVPLVEARASEDCAVVTEQILNSKIESEYRKAQLISEARDQEGLSSHDKLPPSSKVHNDTLQNKSVRPRNPLMDEVVAIDKSKLRKVGERAYNIPRNESKTEEIGSQLQLRKVGERVQPKIEVQYEEIESPRMQLRKVVERTRSFVVPKTGNTDSVLEQIRTKSFNLKPAVMDRPNVQGPRTNLKLVAILQKASNIRQAMAGSDEDDDGDTWSGSDC